MLIPAATSRVRVYHSPCCNPTRSRMGSGTTWQASLHVQQLLKPAAACFFSHGPLFQRLTWLLIGVAGWQLGDRCSQLQPLLHPGWEQHNHGPGGRAVRGPRQVQPRPAATRCSAQPHPQLRRGGERQRQPLSCRPLRESPDGRALECGGECDRCDVILVHAGAMLPRRSMSGAQLSQ
jgi:hypothetical protein